MSNEHIKTRLPVTLDNIPSDDVMAAKYFLDIVNDGSTEMRDCMRALLKAMWMRLVIKDASVSDGDFGDAVGEWYRKTANKDLYAQNVDRSSRLPTVSP